jgi:hypothetical protein
MGNVSELPINSVKIDVPKLLSGINQTVHGQLSRCAIGIRRYETIGEEADPNPVVWQVGNVENPYSCPSC